MTTWFDFMLLVDWGSFLKQWGQLIMLSFLAATVQMYLSGKNFTFFHYFMGVLVAILAAYMGAALCEWQQFDDDLTTGIIAVFAYTAPHILEGLNKFVQYLAQNPKSILASILKVR
jgi:hypothetical protein